jgi:hypothetical protein
VSTASGKGSANNATEDPKALKAARKQAADEADRGVKDAKRTIADLEKSLTDRDPDGVKAARVRLRELKASLRDREADAKRLRAEAKEN